ncbi:MAG TPA: hypothetical protein VGU64_09535 [Terriglobales bacterium]|nr:hypothetical protein [Terriglobales bacterium]
MPKLDEKRVQEAIDRAYNAEVANLFKTFLEDVIEATTGGAGSDFTKADQCVGAFARSMKRATCCLRQGVRGGQADSDR